MSLWFDNAVEKKMNKDIHIFNENEKWFRELYHKGETDVLTKPMTYEEYEHCMELHPEYLDLRTFYLMSAQNSSQKHFREIRTAIQGWAEIFLVKHERYSYPIWHSHDYVEAAYVYSGECTQYIGDYSFTLHTGDLCILSPNTVHCISNCSDDAIVFAIILDKKLFNTVFLDIMKEQSILARFFKAILYSTFASPYILFSTGNDSRLSQLFCEMYFECCDRKKYYKEMLALYMRWAMIHLLRHYETSAIVPSPVDNEIETHLVAVLGYIEANYNHVTLKELAEFFSYSESYLSKLIKHYTGKNFPTLILELQMAKSQELLTNTNMNLAEISQAVGCFDASHFSHKFKKFYGESPSSYRKRILEGPVS